MTEDEVRRVAEQFVVVKGFDKCAIVSIRRFDRSEIDDLDSVGDEWVVQFQFECRDDISAIYTMVVVDDATGLARSIDTL